MNDGIIGNSRMLGCLTKEGELHRLFWPNIDHMQHINRFDIGLVLVGKSEETHFLADHMFHKSQEYVQGTNILKTTFKNKALGLIIEQKDFCLIDQDVLIRQYVIRNLGSKDQEIKWMLYSSNVTSPSHLTGTMFNFEHEALIHYQRDQYMSISSNLDVESFHLGSDTLEAAKNGKLHSLESTLMVPDGAVSWDLGFIEPGREKNITLQIGFESTYKNLKELLSKVRSLDGDELYQSIEQYWLSFVDQHIKKSKNILYDRVYERTLLVFKLMYNQKSGGLMAAPEMDEHLDKCGRYAYCWGRDAAFIAQALDQCGLCNEVEQFFYYATTIQEENGSWLQRYCMDGNLAPSWGLQVDETGSLIYGMWKHYEHTQNVVFLESVWESVKLGSNFLTQFIDSETGLTKPSHDLWEERWGEHTYSAAAVYAGLISGVQLAKVIDPTYEKMSLWEETAVQLKASIERELWDEDHNCFLRGIRTSLYPYEKMKNVQTRMVKANSKGAMKEVVCKDSMVDVSLIGLSVPFDVFAAKDERMIKTVRKIEEELTSNKVGGIKRYKDDEYIGGNPWILATLWVALYHIKNKDFTKALANLDWAVKGRTELDLLPEQICKESGKPIWIVPLTWSHAMFVLVYHELQKEGVL